MRHGRSGPLSDRRWAEVGTPGARNSSSESSVRRVLRQGLGLLICVVCLWAVFREVDSVALATSLDRLDLRFLVLGIAILAAGYALRIARWCFMLRAGGARVGVGACVAPFLGALALNNVLPFRAGDLVRALIFPAAIGVRRTTAVASIVLERCLDVIVLVAALGAGIYASSIAGDLDYRIEGLVAIALGAAVTLMALIASTPWLTPRLESARNSLRRRGLSRIDKLLGVGIDILAGMQCMVASRMLVVLVAVSIVAWCAEAGLFWALLLGMGLDPGFTAGVAIMALATLATMIPSTPGYVGPFHLAAFSMLTLLNASPADAAVFAVLVHLSLWASTTVAGAMAISLNPQLFRSKPAVE
jgi:glycosyltransferase 2 family protein